MTEEGEPHLYCFVSNDSIGRIDFLGLEDPELGVALKVVVGWDSVRGPYISSIGVAGTVSQGLCDTLKMRGDINVRVYNGGPGTAVDQRGWRVFQVDLTGSWSATIGRGRADPICAATPESDGCLRAELCCTCCQPYRIRI